MTDNARIPDHAAWAARGYWRNAYEALLKECKEQADLSPEPALAAPATEPVAWSDYDAGLLNDYGGGDVGWWQDYLRAEIGRANDFWREQVAHPTDAERLAGAAKTIMDNYGFPGDGNDHYREVETMHLSDLETALVAHAAMMKEHGNG
jgi:hypothetical protein